MVVVYRLQDIASQIGVPAVQLPANVGFAGLLDASIEKGTDRNQVFEVPASFVTFPTLIAMMKIGVVDPTVVRSMNDTPKRLSRCLIEANSVDLSNSIESRCPRLKCRA